MDSALLVDFPKSQKGLSSESPEHTPATALTRWIVNYFDDVAQQGMEGGRKSNAFDLLKGGGVVISNRMPIILQVGYIWLVCRQQLTSAS